jgi:threonylcarbamoyladenosine tRNA methylthiotransferase MtaB
LKSDSHIGAILPAFYIQQFGCRATQADGAAIERQLLDRGCTPAEDPNSANVVVVNTCTVTASADAQAREAIRKIHAQNPAAQLIVTGCYAQRAPEELAALPGVSWVVGNSHKPQIPDLIAPSSIVGAGLAPPVDPPSTNSNFISAANLLPSAHASIVGAQHVAPLSARSSTSSSTGFLPVSRVNPKPPIQFATMDAGPAKTRAAQILTGDVNALTEVLVAPVQGGESHHTRPTLKIQDGCNNRCSFCVIPFVRGKSRSLLPETVIHEIQSLTSPTSPYQAREIVLSGINLGTYGRDLTPRVEFEDLLRRILDETTVERLRISSIEPQDVNQDLIELFASTSRLAEHFHMPLQSASDRILAAMHRWYRSEHYARRVHLTHERLPHAAIGADVITGFPGETESDHAATVSFIESLPFTYLHVFSYSPRPGTKAAALPNQVPTHIIKQRARQLRALSQAKSSAFRQSQLGRSLRVLTLHRSAHDERAGRTPALSSNYLTFSIPGNHPHNRWLEIEVPSNDSATVTADTNDLSVASSLA